MAHYEAHFGDVNHSTFAVGENAAAYGSMSVDPKYQDIARRLAELIDVLAEYDGGESMVEIRSLAYSAQREIHGAPPDKQRLRRLTASMKAVLEKAGPGIIGAGALLDAIAKIAGAIQHL